MSAQEVHQSHEERDPVVPPPGAVRSAVVWTAIVAVLALAVGLLLNAAWLFRNAEPARLAILESFAAAPAGESVLERSFESFNDCLIPIMTLLKEGDRTERVLTAQRTYRSPRPQRVCDALREVVSRRRSPGPADLGLSPDLVAVDYHQYWIGHRFFVQELFGALGVRGTKLLLHAVTWTLLLALLVVAILRARSPAQAADAAIVVRFGPLAVALALILFFDLQRRASSLTSAPGNLSVLLTLLCCWLWPSVLLATTRRRVILFAAFGALNTYFALLFGNLTIAFAVCLFLAASCWDPTARSPNRLPGRLLRDGLIGFCGAVALVYGLRLVVVEVVAEGPVLRAFLDQIAFRTLGDPRELVDPALSEMFRGEVSLSRALANLDRRVASLGFGSAPAGRTIVALGAVLLASSTVAIGVLWKTLSEKARLLALLGSAWVVPVWYIVFLGHTQMHARIMIRLGGWTIACSLLLAAQLAVILRDRRRAARSRPG